MKRVRISPEGAVGGRRHETRGRAMNGPRGSAVDRIMRLHKRLEEAREINHRLGVVVETSPERSLIRVAEMEDTETPEPAA